MAGNYGNNLYTFTDENGVYNISNRSDLYPEENVPEDFRTRTPGSLGVIPIPEGKPTYMAQGNIAPSLPDYTGMYRGGQIQAPGPGIPEQSQAPRPMTQPVSQGQPPQPQQSSSNDGGGDGETSIYQQREDFRKAFIKENNLVDPYKINADEEARKLFGGYPSNRNFQHMDTFDRIKNRVVERIRESKEYIAEAMQRWEEEHGFSRLKQGESSLKGGKVSAIGGYPHPIPADSAGFDTTGKVTYGPLRAKAGEQVVLRPGENDQFTLAPPVPPKEIDETKWANAVAAAKKDVNDRYLFAAKTEANNIRAELEGMSEDKRIAATVVPEGKKLTPSEKMKIGTWKAVKDAWNKSSNLEDFNKWASDPSNVDVILGPSGARARNEDHAKVDRMFYEKKLGIKPSDNQPPSSPVIDPPKVDDPYNPEKVARGLYKSTPEQQKAYGESIKNDPKAIKTVEQAMTWMINPETGKPDTDIEPYRPGSPIPTSMAIEKAKKLAITKKENARYKEKDNTVKMINQIAADLVSKNPEWDEDTIKEQAALIMEENKKLSISGGIPQYKLFRK